MWRCTVPKRDYNKVLLMITFSTIFAAHFCNNNTFFFFYFSTNMIDIWTLPFSEGGWYRRNPFYDKNGVSCSESAQKLKSAIWVEFENRARRFGEFFFLLCFSSTLHSGFSPLCPALCMDLSRKTSLIMGSWERTIH